jgi:tRNA U34 5-carboxymethylaminomethyl modifying GTPase MnmE/TrmE
LEKLNPGNIKCRSVNTIEKAYTVFEEKRPGDHKHRIDLNAISCVADSINVFNIASGNRFAIIPGSKSREVLVRLNFLEETRKAAREYSGKKLSQTLEKYARSADTPHKAKELLRLWWGLNENVDTDAAMPRIVVCGKLKAGKSSLLNMLTDHFDDDPPFKIDVVRATKEEQILEYDGVCYVDTPGLDALDEDAETAEQSFLKADCFIFVHALNGELDRPEVEILNRLRRERPKTIKNMLVVLTHADGDLDDAEKLNRLRGKIEEQIADILGTRMSVTTVSNTRYAKGMRENKRTLVKTSGIRDLQQHIVHSLRPRLIENALENRKAELAGIVREMESLIETDITNTEQRLRKLTEADKQVYASMLREYQEICVNWRKEVQQL